MFVGRWSHLFYAVWNWIALQWLCAMAEIYTGRKKPQELEIAGRCVEKFQLHAYCYPSEQQLLFSGLLNNYL